LREKALSVTVEEPPGEGGISVAFRKALASADHGHAPARQHGATTDSTNSPPTPSRADGYGMCGRRAEYEIPGATAPRGEE
jgi:hypothetical protein